MNPPYAPGLPGVPLPPRAGQERAVRNPGVTSRADLPAVRDTRASESRLETAVAIEAALAADRAGRAERDVDDLAAQLAQYEARLQILETAMAQRAERQQHKTAVRVVVISTVGSLIVGLVLWGVNFAATTKAAAAARATEATKLAIAKSQPSAIDQYEKAAQDGAEKALARQRQDLADHDLVVVPRSLLVKSQSAKR